MTLQEAVEYINTGIKEGYFEPEQFEKMTKEELIKFAQYNADKGDYYANDNETEHEK
jgi:hypothetical protein